MTKFIKLTVERGRTIYINVNQITYFNEWATDSGLTFVQFSHTDEYEKVQETPEQILALIEAANG